MNRAKMTGVCVTLAALTGLVLAGCRGHMPHAFTWPAGGDIQQTHAKPPEGGYWTNWDPYAVELEVTPLEDVNPVRTQHYIIATVKDKDGRPLPNRRVEWIINQGSVGDIVEVDESGWRASRGYKVDNHYAVSHTNNGAHVIDMGDSDPSNDISLTEGQTFCVITSPIEGDTHITVYAPGIYDRSRHKVFAVKHWYDVKWECPPPATNPVGTTHQLATRVSKYSDNSPLPGYMVTYKIVDGPAGAFDPGGQQTVTVPTDGSGMAVVTLRQAQPAQGTNNIDIEIVRPENIQCCKPGVRIAQCRTSKTWIAPQITCDKRGPASVLAGDQFEFNVTVSNPSQVDATNVTVTDAMPDGLQLVSSDPPGSGTWNLGTVAAGSSRSLRMMVKATRTGRFENCAEVRADMGLQTRCCASVVASSPALALEKQCPSEVVICDPIPMTIIVRNTGDGPARNVQINDNLPDGLTTDGGRTSVAANVGDLGPGEAKQVRFVAKASRTGRFDNRASATADGGLSAEASCSTTVRQPMLAVTKTGPNERYIGRPATYEITVMNKGDIAARDTVLVDPLPAGTEFVSAEEGGTFSGGTVTWRLGNMEPGASRTVRLTLKPTQRGTAKNTATATAFCTEAGAETMMGVRGVAALLLECVDVADPIEVGANETYIIEVTNQGTENDTNIVITCEVPPEMEYVDGTGPNGEKPTVTGKTIKFPPYPSLPPKAKIQYRVITKGVTPADVRFKVQMDSDVLASPVNETESTHVY